MEKPLFRSYPRMVGRRASPLIVTIVLLLLYIVHLKRRPEAVEYNTQLIPVEADRKNWSLSSGKLGAGMYQPPRRPQKMGERIAVATMSTHETTFDHISLSNKLGTPRPRSRTRAPG